MAFTHFQLIYLTADTLRLADRPAPVDSRTLQERAKAQTDHFVRLVFGAFNKVVGPDLIDQSPGVLKIVMAPEFYFRDPLGNADGTGQYGRSELINILGMLEKQLGSFLAGAPWLVVPGSIVWTMQNDRGGMIVQNTAPLFDFTRATTTRVGGIQVRVDGTRTQWCDKAFFSEIDELDAVLNGNAHRAARPQVLGYQSDQFYQVIDGPSIGIEICLDHACGVLWGALATQSSASTSTSARAAPRRVDLHLIVACGMDLIGRYSIAKDRGHVLRCNGNRFNSWSPENPEVASPDQSIRSDVYRGVRRPDGRVSWQRVDVMAAGQHLVLPAYLQRPWRHPGVLPDGLGVSPVFPIG